MNDSISEPEPQPATVADRLAREIKRLRLEADLSQRALATKIGYSRQYVSMTEWEDANLPSQDLVAAIDTALGANGTLITRRTQAKIGQQTARRKSSSPGLGGSTAFLPANAMIEQQASLDVAASVYHFPDTSPVNDDNTSTEAACLLPAGHTHKLTATAVGAIYPCQADAADDVRALAKEAGSVDVMAVRGLGILGLNDSLLRKTIPAEAQLRVLLLSPDSEAVARRANEIGESTESFATGIRLAIVRVKELATRGRPVEVYTYNQIPVWRIIKIDEVLFVSAFTIQHEGHASPIHRIEPSVQGVLHHAFVRTLEQAFSYSDRVV